MQDVAQRRRCVCEQDSKKPEKAAKRTASIKMTEAGHDTERRGDQRLPSEIAGTPQLLLDQRRAAFLAEACARYDHGPAASRAKQLAL
jgi:hypothetical protein